MFAQLRFTPGQAGEWRRQTKLEGIALPGLSVEFMAQGHDRWYRGTSCFQEQNSSGSNTDT
jgi:hypothetical protein